MLYTALYFPLFYILYPPLKLSVKSLYPSLPLSSVPTDYKSISLLSILSKLLKKLIADNLLHFLYSNSLFSLNQFGFLPFRLITDTLISVCHTSPLSTPSFICGMFIHIMKAFNSFNHSSLLRKLHQPTSQPILLVQLIT